MSKYYLKRKDNVTRKLFRSKELFRLRVKCLQTHYLMDFESKCLIYNKFLKRYYNNYSFTKVVNKCMFTYSSRSLLRKFRLTRAPLRKLVLDGAWMGVRKSSW